VADSVFVDRDDGGEAGEALLGNGGGRSHVGWRIVEGENAKKAAGIRQDRLAS